MSEKKRKKLRLKLKRKSNRIKKSSRFLRHREAMSTIKNTYKNMKYNFKAILAFEMCYRLLTLCIFVPINKFIVSRFIKTEGIFALTNKEFFKFALTPIGIITTIVLMVFSFCVIFVEISVLTYIANMSHKKKRVTIIEGVFNSFSIVPRTLGIRSIVPLFLITAVIGPLIGVGLCSSLIKKLTIPTFVTIELFKTTMGKAAYGIFILILVFLLFRWVLAIPEIIIEDKKSTKCLKNSKVLYKKNRLTLFVYMTMWVVINSTILVVLKKLFLQEEKLFASVLGTNSIAFLIVGGIFLIIYYALFAIISITLMPIFISFLVELFYKVRSEKVKERKFFTNEDYKNNKIYNFSKIFARNFLLLSVAVFSIVLMVRGTDIVFNTTMANDTELSAHRGSAYRAPENSISSIRAAIEDRAEYAEIDVQTTEDNVVVLFHDLNLKRINGSNKAIKDLTYDEVNKVDNGSYFNSDFAGEKIPTLEDVLKEAKGKIKLNIELKPMKNNDPLSYEVVNLIKQYDMENEVVITSMDYDALEEAKSYDPIIKYGYIIVMSVGNIDDLNVDFISIESSLIKPSLVTDMHSRGKEVFAWTVNNEDEARDLMLIGVDNIITDNVKSLQDVRENLDSTNMDYLQFYLESIINISKYAKI